MSFSLKLVFIALLFYLFALLESSFLIPFTIYNILPNLILCFIIALFFVRGQVGVYHLLVVLLGGFFLDIFSTSSFGIFIFDLLLLFFILKFISSITAERGVFFFISILLLSIVFYELFYSFFNMMISGYFYMKSFKLIIIEFLYNLPFALFFYYYLNKKREKFGFVN